MFEARRQNNSIAGVGLRTLGLIYHSTVRNVRKGNRNAIVGLIVNILQTVIFVGVFYAMFAIMGMRGASIAGADFLLYIMSGIFVFMTHTKAFGAVVGSEGPTHQMMQHAPLNTAITICAAALGSLYIQVLSVTVILFVYHVAFVPIEIEYPIATFGMFLLSWISGCAIGLIFLAIKPWAPGFVAIASQLYSRANMVASGKMFVANAMPGFLLQLFDWNPLFHCIDQVRGFAFVNYLPQNSSALYPVYITLAATMIGLMGEFYTRKYASASWAAGR